MFNWTPPEEQIGVIDFDAHSHKKQGGFVFASIAERASELLFAAAVNASVCSVGQCMHDHRQHQSLASTTAIRSYLTRWLMLPLLSRASIPSPPLFTNPLVPKSLAVSRCKLQSNDHAGIDPDVCLGDRRALCGGFDTQLRMHLAATVRSTKARGVLLASLCFARSSGVWSDDDDDDALE